MRATLTKLAALQDALLVSPTVPALIEQSGTNNTKFNDAVKAKDTAARPAMRDVAAELSLLRRVPSARRRHIILRESAVAVAVLIVFLFVGDWLLAGSGQGAWYRRAYFDDGTPLGSSESPECRIDSISQSSAVLSGAGDAKRARMAMEAVNTHLVRRTDGLIQLLDPPFDTSSLAPGYIRGYVPGVRENGGQYTHAAIWAVMAFAAAGERPQAPAAPGKTILLTSGTTGTPKGAKHSGGGLGELKAILDRVPWHTDRTVVVVAPMFHAWGFSQLVFAASMACTVVTRRKFDPQATLALVDKYQATGLCVVPVMFDRIMELPDHIRNRYSGRSLRFAAASGSRMRPDVVTSFMDQFGDVIYNNYNATEAGMIATATPADLRAAPDTAGRPAEGTEIKILDSDFKELPTGEVGTIYVRNSTQFDGYTSGATKDFHQDYMSSGDVGYLDVAGRLFVVGRDDEMIVSGGENVYPIEVEKTLLTHPEVAEATVLGVDDEQYGQRLVAFVVLADGAAATEDVLKQHVRDNLANYKVPRSITVLAELPRNSTGKIDRRELKELANGA